MNALLHAFYNGAYTRTAFASFAPLVTESAQMGDAVALGILHSAANELARYTEAVFRTLFSELETAQVATIGGVFRSAPLRRSFEEILRRHIRCTVTPPKFEPAAGALLDALRLDGNSSELSGWPKG
jgi:N-acetylglucosamine kinase-like BadF-type ATPase